MAIDKVSRENNKKTPLHFTFMSNIMWSHSVERAILWVAASLWSVSYPPTVILTTSFFILARTKDSCYYKWVRDVGSSGGGAIGALSPVIPTSSSSAAPPSNLTTKQATRHRPPRHY